MVKQLIKGEKMRIINFRELSNYLLLFIVVFLMFAIAFDSYAATDVFNKAITKLTEVDTGLRTIFYSVAGIAGIVLSGFCLKGKVQWNVFLVYLFGVFFVSVIGEIINFLK